MEGLNLAINLRIFYLLFSGVLVIFMLAGFCLLSAGLVRSKNVVSVLTNNIAGFAVGILLFLLLGYHFFIVAKVLDNAFFPDLRYLFQETKHWHYLVDEQNKMVNFSRLFLQSVMIAIPVAIIAGATAERLKLWALLLFVTVLAVIIYPVLNFWFFEGGILFNIGFIDEAGASRVHLLAAIAAFVALLLLGPREGKYNKGKKIKPIFGSNIPLAALGMMFIWVGSFGFNSAHIFIYTTNIDMQKMALVFMNTTIAAISAVFVVIVVLRIFYRRVDLSLILNAAIIGMVAISAAPTKASILGALIIGASAGILGILFIALLEKIKIDDPIGAVAVHGVGSIWGLLAAAFLIEGDSSIGWLKQLAVQLNGILLVSLWAFVASFVTWVLIHLLIGLRTPQTIEERGIDIYDCGIRSYPEFTNE